MPYLYFSEEKALIEVKNLTKKYGASTAVDNISFVIERGRIYGFLGPNGAGKSTTMNMLTGCLSPTEGSIAIDGIDILSDASAAKKKIGYLPETPPVYPDMTPEEYLRFVAEAKGVKGKDIYEQVYTVMEETDILHMKDRLIKNLSKGYKQRVGIAQAMLGDPQVIILDEPTVGLDPKQITEIRELISRLGKTRTVILSSHILAEVSAVCDYVMIINGGRLIAADTLENIRRDNTPENRFSLTVKGEGEAVKAMLSQFPEIISVTLNSENGITEADIDLTLGSDIREALFFAFAKRGMALLELKKVVPSLEEIFLSLTDASYGRDAEDDEDEDEDCEDEDEYDDDEDADEYEEDEEDEEDDGEDSYTPLFGGRRS